MKKKKKIKIKVLIGKEEKRRQKKNFEKTISTAFRDLCRDGVRDIAWIDIGS